MTIDIKPAHALPEEVKDLVWRIFGKGKSLYTNQSPYELIEPITNRHASDTNKRRIISEICSWFEPQGNQCSLKAEKREIVANLILEEVREVREDTAIWAIAWIDPELVIRHIHSNWDLGEVESFVEAIVSMLKKFSDNDEILDATGFLPFDMREKIKNAKIGRDSIVRNGLLETYRNVRENLRFLLHRPLIDLVEIIIGLQPEKFESFVERLDHPVVQAWAVDFVMTKFQDDNHRASLQWIKKGACDGLIALSIVHTLNTVNRIDTDITAMGRFPLERIQWRTEIRPPKENLDAAARALITDLINRLNTLDPLVFARWIGELLRYTPSVFRSQNSYEIPDRVKQLEETCIASLAHPDRLVLFNELLVVFRAELSQSRRTTWTRHMAKLALEIRNGASVEAAKISRLILEIHERQIEKKLASGGLYLDWSIWEDHMWVKGISTALALSHENLDILRWLTEKCQRLPLSAWEAEENLEEFRVAHTVALHWFYIALEAMQQRKELGYSVDPIEVCTIVETLWSHCHFVAKHIRGAPEFSNEVEFAARVAVDLGNASDVWLLKQARDLKLGPRALYALLDQRMLKRKGEGVMDVLSNYDEEIIAEIARLAAEHFGEGTHFAFGSLRWWAQLWLKLGMSHQAERLIRATMAFPPEFLDRHDMLMLLKLLALVLSKERQLDLTLADYLAWLYSKLWPDPHTAEEEKKDREQIDEILRQVNFSGLPAVFS